MKWLKYRVSQLFDWLHRLQEMLNLEKGLCMIHPIIAILIYRFVRDTIRFRSNLSFHSIDLFSFCVYFSCGGAILIPAHGGYTWPQRPSIDYASQFQEFLFERHNSSKALEVMSICRHARIEITRCIIRKSVSSSAFPIARDGCSKEEAPPRGYGEQGNWPFLFMGTREHPEFLTGIKGT